MNKNVYLKADKALQKQYEQCQLCNCRDRKRQSSLGLGHWAWEWVGIVSYYLNMFIFAKEFGYILLFRKHTKQDTFFKNVVLSVSK